MSALRLNSATNLLDRGHDVRIGATAADIPAHGLLHIVVAMTVWLLEKRDGGHDLPGRAVPALEPVMFEESRLHRVQCSGLAKTLNGRDRLVLVGDGKAEA